MKLKNILLRDEILEPLLQYFARETKISLSVTVAKMENPVMKNPNIVAKYATIEIETVLTESRIPTRTSSE